VKKKWELFASIFQLLVGVAAIASFVVLATGGEDMTRWIITVVPAVGYLVMGIMGIVEWIKK
jgi:carbon starvation protein CstA